ncbi:hypothetical protein ALC62_07841 [Cyphomyrmex costatus]|uniref:Uncharacterized protein n=1 Tax=Cyphomyrmex costatus TaxID=456900 RepID=A0A151IH89_9HYME|nr:hypothetical protein ALC62_07841 [Cyphomyrmex costatus]
MSANMRKFFGEAVARVANFPVENCCSAKSGGGRKSTKRTLPREEMKIFPGGHRTFARHASHGLVPPREIPVQNTKAQQGFLVDELPRLRAKHYDLRHMEDNQIYLSPLHIQKSRPKLSEGYLNCMRIIIHNICQFVSLVSPICLVDNKFLSRIENNYWF